MLLRTHRCVRVAVASLLVGLLVCAVPAVAVPATAAGDRFSEEPFVASETSEASDTRTERPAATGPSFTRVGLSLAAVAGLIVGIGWVYRKTFAAQQQKSGGAVKLVSRTMLTPKHQVMVLRTGHRLLIVGDSGHGMNVLTEITDPGEMTAILGETAGDAELDDLRGDAFAATLDAAGGGYLDHTSLPDGDEDPGESPPEEDSLDFARGEMQSLIERVRGLAGQMNAQPGAATGSATTRDSVR